MGSASRVINGAVNVSQATREKVERAIALLGYRPSHAAQALRSRSTKTVGCMISDVTNPLYARLFQAIEARLRTEGYVLLLANGLNNAEREREIMALFQQRRMDGIIVTPGNERDPGILAALNTDMPAVIVDRDMRTRQDAVMFDHVPAMKCAVTHLLDLGHRRIALLVSRVEVRPNRRRVEGFRAAFRAYGLPCPEELIRRQTTSARATFDEVLGLLQSPDPPTAFIVQGTNTLAAALNAISAAGRRIPDDVSLISIGDPDFAQTHVPPIGALRIDPEVVADRIATLLLDRMRRTFADPAPRRSVVRFQFEPRGSCAPPRPR